MTITSTSASTWCVRQGCRRLEIHVSVEVTLMRIYIIFCGSCVYYLWSCWVSRVPEAGNTETSRVLSVLQADITESLGVPSQRVKKNVDISLVYCFFVLQRQADKYRQSNSTSHRGFVTASRVPIILKSWVRRFFQYGGIANFPNTKLNSTVSSRFLRASEAGKTESPRARTLPHVQFMFTSSQCTRSWNDCVL